MLDVLIVGAGLSGLSCAHHLHRQGLSFRLIEKSDRVGGRVRTDVINGYRLDRGFQVLLTAYPETQALLDYKALRLNTFYDGALIRYDGAFHRATDPFRHPLESAGTLFSPIGNVADKLKVARFRQKVRNGDLDALFEREELSSIEALRTRWGFSDAIIDRFFRPFLGGIFLDADLQASSRMLEFVFRMFSTGTAALPADGMEAIPLQLAAGLPDDAIWLNATVTQVGPGHVRLENDQRYEARSVVLATEAPEAAELVPDIDPPLFRSTMCLYYSSDTPPVPDPVLVLNGEGTGPVNNLCVPSNVTPTYAPPGKALISVAVLGNPMQRDSEVEQQVRAQLTGWFGSQVQDWSHVRSYRIPYALPDQTPPFLSPPERPARLPSGLYVCGDYRATASINGALAAGRRAAEAVTADLR